MVRLIQFARNQVCVPLCRADIAVPSEFLGNADIPACRVQDDGYEIVPERMGSDLPDQLCSQTFLDALPDDGAASFGGHVAELMFPAVFCFFHIAAAMAGEDRQGRNLPAAPLIQPAPFI